jgi:CheY-like chemotaxis protein
MPDLRVLFVEDDLILNMDICATLEDAGLSVTCAYSYASAIEAISRRDYLSALITDIDLGAGPDGFNVAHYARKLYPRLPVVFVSGTMGAHHPAKGVEGSVFLAKPFHPTQIIRALDQALRRDAA